jgi:hypothetical protein
MLRVTRRTPSKLDLDTREVKTATGCVDCYQSLHVLLCAMLLLLRLLFHGAWPTPLLSVQYWVGRSRGVLDYSPCFDYPIKLLSRKLLQCVICALPVVHRPCTRLSGPSPRLANDRQFSACRKRGECMHLGIC